MGAFTNSLVCLLLVLVVRSQCMHVSSDGGYSEVVVRVEDDLVDEAGDCGVLVDTIKMFLASSSAGLESALAGACGFAVMAVGRKYFYGSGHKNIW